MIRKPNLAYLTGTAEVLENHLLTDTLKNTVRPERSLSHMFFQPYESKKEAIYCAHKTGFALAGGLLFYFLPGLALNLALGAVILTLGIYGISAILRSCGDYANSGKTLDLADEITSKLCQMAVDILFVPASITIMLTRSLSTGLKEAKIYDFGQPGEHSRECFEFSM